MRKFWDIEQQTSASGTLLRRIYISLVLRTVTQSELTSELTKLTTTLLQTRNKNRYVKIRGHRGAVSCVARPFFTDTGSRSAKRSRSDANDCCMYNLRRGTNPLIQRFDMLTQVADGPKSVVSTAERCSLPQHRSPHFPPVSVYEYQRFCKPTGFTHSILRFPTSVSREALEILQLHQGDLRGE